MSRILFRESNKYQGYCYACLLVSLSCETGANPHICSGCAGCRWMRHQGGFKQFYSSPWPLWFSFKDCSDVPNFFTASEVRITADKFLTKKFVTHSRFGVKVA